MMNVEYDASGNLVLVDGMSTTEYNYTEDRNVMQIVFMDGISYDRDTLDSIRERLDMDARKQVARHLSM